MIFCLACEDAREMAAGSLAMRGGGAPRRKGDRREWLVVLPLATFVAMVGTG